MCNCTGNSKTSPSVDTVWIQSGKIAKYNYQKVSMQVILVEIKVLYILVVRTAKSKKTNDKTTWTDCNLFKAAKVISAQKNNI